MYFLSVALALTTIPTIFGHPTISLPDAPPALTARDVAAIAAPEGRSIILPDILRERDNSAILPRATQEAGRAQKGYGKQCRCTRNNGAERFTVASKQCPRGEKLCEECCKENDAVPYLDPKQGPTVPQRAKDVGRTNGGRVGSNCKCVPNNGGKPFFTDQKQCPWGEKLCVKCCGERNAAPFDYQVRPATGKTVFPYRTTRPFGRSSRGRCCCRTKDTLTIRFLALEKCPPDKVDCEDCCEEHGFMVVKPPGPGRAAGPGPARR